MTTSAQRTAKHRQKRQDEGWKIVHCLIPPREAGYLAEILQKEKISQAEAIAKALDLYRSEAGY